MDLDNQAKPELYPQVLQPEEDRVFQVPVERVGNVNAVPSHHFHDEHRTRQLLLLNSEFVFSLYYHIL